VLARQPALPVSTYRKIVEHCRKLGFPVEKLIVEQVQER
jgi:lipocalin